MRASAALLVLTLIGCDDERLPHDRCAEADASTSQSVAAFSGRCSRKLDVESDPASPDFGRVPCVLYAAFPAASADCACDAKGYAPASNVPPVVTEQLHASGRCGQDACCSNLCVCEFLQLEGAELETCQNNPNESLPLHGWCYVSPEQGVGNPEIVEGCRVRIFPYRSKLLGIMTCQFSVSTIHENGG